MMYLFSEPAPTRCSYPEVWKDNRKGWEEKIIKPVYVFEQGSEKINTFTKIKKLVSKSLELLSKEDILGESRIQELVDEVYSNGYQGSDLASFEMVKKTFPKIS